MRIRSRSVRGDADWIPAFAGMTILHEHLALSPAAAREPHNNPHYSSTPMDAPVSSFKNRPFRARLGFAAAGIRAVAVREKSFRTQLACAAAAAATAAWLRPGWLWCALLLLAAAFVLALEMANAALEYALDALHPHHAPEIGRAKDAAAGAVLIASGAAAAVGAAMLASLFL